MRVLGTAVGGVILITNMRTFLKAVGLNGEPVVAYGIYAVIVAVWLAALAFSIWVNRQEKGGKGSTAQHGQPA